MLRQPRGEMEESICKRRAKLMVLFGFLHTTQTSGDGANERPPKKEETAGRLAAAVSSPEDDALAKLNLPKELPSILEIKKALPAHCFEPSLSTSLYYMVKDFGLVLFLCLLSEWAWQAFPPLIQVFITPLYWFLQGTMFMAIFVVGHDANHGSFSKYERINDLCGSICHTFLFCPYYMWKLSHRHHHKNTGNIDKEEVFYPVRKKDDNHAKVLPGFGLFIGWFVYLVMGYKPRAVAHFNPMTPMFRGHVKNCLVSLVFMVVWCTCLYRFKEEYGWGYLLYHHTVPVCVFGCYIVIITFLHHTEDNVPWYSDHLWDYVRGQLSSVDRHYGWCHELIHNIGTHQVHHLFPKIPHYHLEEATAAFRKAFPELVCIRREPILPAFCRMFKKYAEQSVTADDALIHIYR